MTTILASVSSNTTVLLIGVAVLLLLFWYLATEKDRRKRNIGTLIVAIVTVCSLFAIVSPANLMSVVTGKQSFKEATNLDAGIDLVGGTSVIMEVQPNIDPQTGKPIKVDKQAMEAVRAVLEARVNKFGALQVNMNLVGENRVEVQIPKLSPERAEELISLLKTAAKLTIHQVVRGSESKIMAATDSETGELDHTQFSFEEVAYPNTSAEKTPKYVLLKRAAEVTGKDVKLAYVRPDDYSIVDIELTSDGADKMRDFTRRLDQGVDRIATVLDKKVVNHATLNAETLGKRFVITGLDSKKEAEELVKALKNPLENEIVVIDKRAISATLGEQTINQGVTAGLVGLGLTLIFVLLYYRYAGIIALIGLSVNILILFGAMAAFGASFTLPGIAGIILTIGVAVDANVLIYERMREELALGKSVKAAIAAAYDKAFSAIFDANITTLITATILFWQASGSIRGFAVTLVIGIIGTLLAALLCTRVLFAWSSDTGTLKKVNFMNLVPQKAFDFLSKRKFAFLFSSILIIGGLVTFGTKGKNNLGIDFVGGDIVRFIVPEGKEVTQAQLDKAFEGFSTSKQFSKQLETPESSLPNITIKCSSEDKDALVAQVRKTFSFYQEKVQQKDSKGELVFDSDNNPVMEYKYAANSEFVSASLGAEFLQNAIWALLFGLIAVLVYITVRFEFSFAVGAFFALIHDVLITIGLLAILGQELTQIHIAAFLTLIGYSINDTIVVFDRIRENLKTKRGEVKDVMNGAISSTLSRTVLTSVTTFVAVLVLFIFGGAALKDFSLTIMIGVIVGTYSSIFIASPIVYIFSKMRGINLRRELLDANLEAQVNPAGSKS